MKVEKGMGDLFRNRWFKGLVAWCGIWEAGHLLLTIDTMLGSTDFPPPPPEGWTSQTRAIFDGIVASDSIQAALCLVFVVGYFLRQRWSFVLGLVCLASSAFNSYAFTRYIIGTGAWAAHAADYTMIQILWAPLFFLFLWLCRALVAATSSEQPGLQAPQTKASAAALQA